jgi:hypothetical protein
MQETIFCNKCNSKINKNDNYCQYCGAKTTKKIEPIMLFSILTIVLILLIIIAGANIHNETNSFAIEEIQPQAKNITQQKLEVVKTYDCDNQNLKQYCVALKNNASVSYNKIYVKINILNDFKKTIKNEIYFKEKLSSGETWTIKILLDSKEASDIQITGIDATYNFN